MNFAFKIHSTSKTLNMHPTTSNHIRIQDRPLRTDMLQSIPPLQIATILRLTCSLLHVGLHVARHVAPTRSPTRSPTREHPLTREPTGSFPLHEVDKTREPPTRPYEPRSTRGWTSTREVSPRTRKEGAGQGRTYMEPCSYVRNLQTPPSTRPTLRARDLRQQVQKTLASVPEKRRPVKKEPT